MSLFGTALGGRVGDRLRAASWRGRVRQVLDLLDEERALIQRGDLRGLAGLAPRSRAALEELISAPASESRDGEPELEAIRGSAARNLPVFRTGKSAVLSTSFSHKPTN